MSHAVIAISLALSRNDHDLIHSSTFKRAVSIRLGGGGWTYICIHHGATSSQVFRGAAVESCVIVMHANKLSWPWDPSFI